MKVTRAHLLLPVSVLTAIVIAVAIIGMYPILGSSATFTNSIGMNVVVPSSCTPSLSNTLLSFPSTYAGGYAPTSNVENVINFGNAASNILVFGTNWIADPTIGNFLVGNTLWNPTTQSGNIGNQLSLSAVDTKIPMAANGGANVIFFGLNIPPGQGAGTYNQVITIETSC